MPPSNEDMAAWQVSKNAQLNAQGIQAGDAYGNAIRATHGMGGLIGSGGLGGPAFLSAITGMGKAQNMFDMSSGGSKFVRMRKTYILGIAGRAGAGKDTFAAAYMAALKEAGLTTTKYSFADPLKQACEVLFGGDDVDHWWTQEGKAAAFPFWADKLGKRYASGRDILVTVGTDVIRRNVSNSFWLSVAEWRTARCDVDVIVIADVRFDNEAKWIRAMGGDVIEVQNVNQAPLKRAGKFVRWLRHVPYVGLSSWCRSLLVRLGYASHPSEDGISTEYITTVGRYVSATQNADHAAIVARYYNRVAPKGSNGP